jgi:hypothetical protein
MRYVWSAPPTSTEFIGEFTNLLVAATYEETRSSSWLLQQRDPHVVPILRPNQRRGRTRFPQVGPRVP